MPNFLMTWDEFYHFFQHKEEESEGDNDMNFDFSSVLPKPKDFYNILEVDHDDTEEVIRSNYIRLALKCHPDKKKDEDSATSRFQDINEAYQGISSSFFLINCVLCLKYYMVQLLINQGAFLRIFNF
ncbi:protein tumorous imaginal discs, mitochondrial-like isoform X1 [Olea europaea var. sylvestris]|uniref:protein tumorous imaginal discs, mitochondrial-like isoform X1 n=1 Tax=Olea europaea var. sylvestris TaxID=158386 RepID=UPI000C1D04C9|nr:protein tumorous imaginal discs, mitochondrial-like isoform X1 [Olea europaea var. sylvestris]